MSEVAAAPDRGRLRGDSGRGRHHRLERLQRREARRGGAEACATAADTVRNNANEYNALLNGDAADAAAVKAEQVKDSKTVESLGKELKAMAPEYEGCVAEDAQGLDAAAVKLNEQADWYETHEKSLSKAVRAVVESKAAKRLDDAKTNLTAKLDEASKLLADSDGKVADNATRDHCRTPSTRRTG